MPDVFKNRERPSRAPLLFAALMAGMVDCATPPADLDASDGGAPSPMDAGGDAEAVAERDTGIDGSPTRPDAEGGADAPTAPDASEVAEPMGELIFRTGFEGSTAVIQGLYTNPPYPDIVNDRMADVIGVDETLPSHASFPELEARADIGTFRIYYEGSGGTPAERLADLVEDPTRPGNHVLSFRLATANVTPANAAVSETKGRIQADIYGNEGIRELYQSVRVYLGEGFREYREMPARSTWMTILELWNNGQWETVGGEFPFRISVNLQKPETEVGSPLRFDVHGQRLIGGRWTDDWHVPNTDFEVPVERWMTIETYFLEGTEVDGRFWMAVTIDGAPRQVVFDVHDATRDPADPAPNGMIWNPLKLYTSEANLDYIASRGRAYEILFDDFMLFRERRPEAASR